MKLYNIYDVVDNKTVRAHERKYVRSQKNTSVPGTLVETNRGYFIDGHHVNEKAVILWNAINNGQITFKWHKEMDDKGNIISKWVELC